MLDGPSSSGLRAIAEKFHARHVEHAWVWIDQPLVRLRDMSDGGASYKAHVPSVEEIEAKLVKMKMQVLAGAPLAWGPRMVAVPDGGLICFYLVADEDCADLVAEA